MVEPRDRKAAAHHQDIDQESIQSTQGHKHDNSSVELLEEVQSTCNTSSSPSPTKDKEHTAAFRLFELPVELRLLIYEYLLVNPMGIYIFIVSRGVNEVVARQISLCSASKHDDKLCRAYLKSDETSDSRPFVRSECYVDTNILKTCKMIHEEAQGLLWKQQWCFANPEALHGFLILLTPASIGLLEEITILEGIHKRDLRHFAFMAPLQYATNLQVLRILGRTTNINPEVRQDTTRGQVVATALFKKMSPFVRALAARRGVEGLLQVIKLHQDDIQGEEPLSEPWNDQREAQFFRGLKETLVKLIGHEHARLQTSA